MRTTTRRTLAFTVAAAAALAAISPSSARTMRSEKLMTPSQAYGAYGAYAQYPNRDGRVGIGPQDAWTPGYGQAAPGQCWVDEGYGRWSTCSGSN